eukprot:TRINITY_DN10617_c0_g1_i1.p1 TRINITY_DN10617_c0_g1~~TRINITY_DN10617_c0_g1_i1.p1  ORF type:complete len:297 (+),score=61.11 TRINITY_DN10617_c0_g1_i1:47-892(+)
MPLLLIEHLNMSVSDEKVSLDFYSALGCVLVTGRVNKTMHVNCGGMTQFHLPNDEGRTDLWKGDIELGYGSSEAHAESISKLVTLGYKPTTVDANCSSVVGPDGNVFILKFDPAATTLNVEGAKRLAAGSPDSWIQNIVVEVPVGSSPKISKFYNDVLLMADQKSGLCPRTKLPFISVMSSYGQALRFQESETPKQTNDHEHCAIYISDFEATFDEAAKRGLVFVNERFRHIDWASTKEEALECNQFRLINIVDEDGCTIVKVEHEIRNTSHPGCPLPVKA